MKNVLLLIHDDDGQEARFQAALDLTRELSGHLSCLDVSAMPLLMGGDSGYSAGFLLEEERTREAANRAKLEARLPVEAVSWDWSDATGSPADCILEEATLADIIVLNTRLDHFSHPELRDVASRVLTHARSPVLAVPDTLERLSLDRVLVAWDGQVSCAATLRAVVPLLKLASAVQILTIRDGSERVPPTAAAAYLSRHGIDAEVRIVEDGLHPADQHIASACTAFRADYVMMGAYSHGRLMETFGGVTKRLLAKSQVPLLLGH